jgi:ribose 5-phosphate isomerase B
MKEIFIGADHGGYELKTKIMKKYGDFTDCGNLMLDKDDNFPDFAQAVCVGVLANPDSFGILVCGTGIGVSICANRYKGIRAALCHSAEYAKLARSHNDANVLCLGGRFTDEHAAFEIIDAFLNTAADKDPKYKRRMETADGIIS